MRYWKRALSLLGLGEHAEFIWRIFEFFGFDRPLNWVLYGVGSGVSGYLANIANWPPIGVFLAAISAGAGFSIAYAGIHWARFAAPRPLTLPATGTAQRVQIIFGTERPFVTVEPAGKNRNRTVRVKIKNLTSAEISNGTVRILNLDPPQNGHTNFFLKGDISLGPLGHTYADVAYYSEGTSEALPGRSMRLCVPIPAGFLFNTLPGTLPLSPHTFHLRFSSLEDHTLDEAYCRLSVDQNHVLHLENWGDSTKPHVSSTEPAAIELRWKPGGANDPYEVNAVVTPSLTIKDFVLIARFATVIHYANGSSKWLWQPSIRMTGPRDLFREETVQTPLIRCPRSAGGANEMIFFDNKTWKIEDSQLILLRLSAVCDGHTINLQKAFHQRRFGETVVLDTTPLEDIAYIEGAEAAT